MDVFSIASGSSGNAYLVRAEGTTILVECGIPMRRITTFLAQHGIDPRALAGILVTHDHSDHAKSARQLSETFDVPVFATPGTLGCKALADTPLARPIQADRPFRLGELDVLAFPVPHDAREPVGFRLTAHAATVTVTTDLGFVPAPVQRQLRDNDLLILEANHDLDLLHTGPYPTFLKRRVLGQHGHLSNAATAEALAACRDRVATEVWLAHLSPVNNRPELALAAVQDHLEARDLGHVALRVAERHRPSLRWSSVPQPRQLSLFA